jgi:hypothetical protein
MSVSANSVVSSIGHFIDDHYGSLGLFVLLMVLIAAHWFMVEHNRDHDMIKWLEAQIEGVIIGLIGLLQRYAPAQPAKPPSVTP